MIGCWPELAVPSFARSLLLLADLVKAGPIRGSDAAPASRPAVDQVARVRDAGAGFNRTTDGMDGTRGARWRRLGHRRRWPARAGQDQAGPVRRTTDIAVSAWQRTTKLA